MDDYAERCRKWHLTLLLTTLIMTNEITALTPICELEPPSQSPPGSEGHVKYRCTITTPADFELVPDNATALTLNFTPDHTVNLSTGAALPADLGGAHMTSLTVSVASLPLMSSSSGTVTEAHRLVPARFFANLPRLIELTLYSPQPIPVRLSAGSFEGLTVLRKLQLSHLGISDKQLPVDVFRGLESVVIIDLSSNRIQRIAHGTFAAAWTALTASGGNDTMFPTVSLLTAKRCCRDLAILGLALNNISNLSDVSLYGLDNLKAIDLHGNRIASIDESSFSAVSTLIEMNLANNLITRLASRSFVGLNRLRTLFLEQNIIASVDPLTFSGLTRLTTLDIGHNSIKAVPTGTFSSATTPRLRKLFLHSNGVERIEARSIDGLGDLRLLQLTNNHLKTLPVNLFDGVPSPFVVRMSGNPWMCNCALYEAVRHAIADDAICRTPSELFGIGLLTVSENAYRNCVDTTTTTMMMLVINWTVAAENDSKVYDAVASLDDVRADRSRPSNSLNIRKFVTTASLVLVVVLVVAVLATLVDCRLRHWGFWNRKRSVNVSAVEADAVVNVVPTISSQTEIKQRRRRVIKVRQSSADVKFDTDIDFAGSPPHMSIGHCNPAASFSDELQLPPAQLSTSRESRKGRNVHNVNDRVQYFEQKSKRTDQTRVGEADVPGAVSAYCCKILPLEDVHSCDEFSAVSDNYFNARMEITLSTRRFVNNDHRSSRLNDIENTGRVQTSLMTVSRETSESVHRCPPLSPMSMPPPSTPGFDDHVSPPPPYTRSLVSTVHN